MNALYPEKLPYDKKTTWYYADNFPADRPLKLTSAFCHRSYNINLHMHDFYELNVVVSGKGVHYTDHQHYPVGVGDVVIIPPKTFHGYYNVDHLDVFHVLLHKNYIQKYAGDLHMLSSFHLLFNEDIKLRAAQAIPQFHIEGRAYDEITRLLWRMDELEVSTNATANRADYLLSYSLCLSVIIELCKEYLRQFSSEEAREEKPSDIGLLRVTDYIHLNYAQHITLNDLCVVSMMSKTQLCEKFREYFGTTPLNYVNQYRVLVAKNMIIETDKTITEIAQDMGFFDVSHFLKTYLKFETENPSALRARIKRTVQGAT